jgi:hypothetical protein
MNDARSLLQRHRGWAVAIIAFDIVLVIAAGAYVFAC